ncbi:Histone-lysine N-methyltransferase SETMAR [Anthophora retusa]
MTSRKRSQGCLNGDGNTTDYEQRTEKEEERATKGWRVFVGKGRGWFWQPCNFCGDLKILLVEKRPSLVNRKGVLFHHDNARPHTARITVEKIKNFNWELLPHPPYSSDLAPSDYHLFRSMQHFLSGKNFNNSEDVKSALNEYFNSKSQKFFENGIRKLTDRWEKVIETDGKYIDD